MRYTSRGKWECRGILIVSYRNYLWMVLALLIFACAPGFAQVVRNGATNVIVYNGSAAPVTVMITCPGVPTNGAQSDGCPTGTISTLRYINITAGGQPLPLTQFATPTAGWFTLPAGQKAQIINMGINPYTRQVSSCLQGMVMGFNQFGNQCADPFNGVAGGGAPNCSGSKPTNFPNTVAGPTFNQAVSPPACLPNGSNAFEFTLNLPGTIAGQKVFNGTTAPTQEATDISCVNGANSKLTVQITPPAGGPYWSTNLGPALGGVKFFTGTTQFGPNSWVNIAGKKDDNCVDPTTGWARPGIYPYGCTICNVLPDAKAPCLPPPASSSQFCAAKNGLSANNGCGYARNPLVPGIQKFGGTLQVNYYGPLQPPGP